MRGNVVVFVVGMIVAAIVGVATSFAMQSLLSEKRETEGARDNTDALANIMESKMTSLEHTMQDEIGGLKISVSALNSQVQSLKKSLQRLNTLNSRIDKAGSGATAAATDESESQPSSDANFENVINRVLEERDKRKEEQRAEERTQKITAMQERFKGMMVSRVEKFADDKGWDVSRTEDVKQIMSEQMEKMSKLFSSRGARKGPPADEMRQIMEETRTQLLEILTEDEVNELLKMPGPFGGGRRGTGGG